MSKNPGDLVKDIYSTVAEGVVVSEEASKEFGATLSKLISDRLNPEDRKRPFTLRMSNLGKGDRQLWYDKHLGRPEGAIAPYTFIKFIYGELVEQLVLFLAELSGHKVTSKQEKVELNGISGHIDADVDGVTTDVKSASSHGFRKFAQKTLMDDDPFGYIEQIAGYSKARDTDGAFLAVDKVTGHLAYLPYTKEELDGVRIVERIEHMKKVIESPEPPPRCHSDVEEGKSGNRVLGVNCSYCDHKFECWKDSNDGLGLRTFLYSTGPKHFTNIEKEPNGPKEITF